VSTEAFASTEAVLGMGDVVGTEAVQGTGAVAGMEAVDEWRTGERIVEVVG
jgi:hypothetical protein